MSNEDYYIFVNGFFFLLWGISVLLFGQVTVKYIEGKLLTEGIEQPVWDKGLGARFIAYAMIIVLKKPKPHSLVDDEGTLRYARKKDWYLSVFFIVTFLLFMFLSVMSYFVYD